MENRHRGRPKKVETTIKIKDAKRLEEILNQLWWEISSNKLFKNGTLSLKIAALGGIDNFLKEELK